MRSFFLRLFTKNKRKLRNPARLAVAVVGFCLVAPSWADITFISASSGHNDSLPTNGTAGALTINKPSGVVAGQTLIASIAARPYGMAYTAPAGWTLMTSTQQTNGGTSTAPGGMNLLTFYKIVGINDSNSYTWTFANSYNTGGSAVGGLLAFSGLDTTSSPIDVWSARLNPSSNTHSTTSITTTVANTMIVSSISFLSASSFSSPTGITGLIERLDQSAPLTQNAVGTTIQMSTAPKVSAGATGASSAVITGDSSLNDYGIGHLMALKPSEVDTAISISRNANLIAGASAAYTITITNNGIKSEPGPLTVVNTLPSGLSYASYSGSGWSCIASGQTVTCTRTGAITPGGSAPALVINVNVSGSASGTIINSATVSGTGGDQNSVNNTAIDTYVFPSVAYAYYAMEESSWGTIQDSSGNGRSATALGSASPSNGALPNSPYSALIGNPGTCGAGQIPSGTTAIGVNTAIDVNNIGNTGTIMFWYSSNQNWNNNTNRILFDASNVSGNNSKHFFLVKNSLGALTFSLQDTAGTDTTATSPSYNFPANEWHHIAVTWDLSLNSLKIYLDGNTTPVATSATLLNGVLGDMATLYLGAQRMSGVTGASASYTNNTANGYIDEARIFQGALSSNEIASLYTQTHACAANVLVVPKPSGFNCIETGLNALSGHLYTKLTNTPFALDVVALSDADNNGVADSVDTNYASDADKQITVELVDGSSASTCSQFATLVPAVNQTVRFTKAGQLSEQGRKRTSAMTVTNAYANVRCRVTDANQTPSIVACSTDNFSIRPAGFAVSSNTNADASGSSANATPTVKAGANFALTASSAEPGYNTIPKVDNSKINAQTGSHQSGSLSGSFNAADPTSGAATGTAFSYSEAGYFRFVANGIYDDTFTTVDSMLGDCTNDFSNTAVNNQYGCNFGNPNTTAYFGRFIPDHLDVTLNTPVFSPTCGTFTYMGQPIKYATNPVATVFAKNSSGTVTQNYTGTFFKITPGDTVYGITPSYTEASQSLTIFNSDPPVVADLGQSLGGSNYGMATLTFADTTFNVLAVTRTSNPINLFSANIALNFTLHDTDGVSVANVNGSAINNSNSTVSFGTASAGLGISFTGGYSTQKWGRLVMSNAHGSELAPITLPLSTEYYNGVTFVLNTNDSCTAISLNGQIYLSNSLTGGGASQSGTAIMNVGSGTSSASLQASLISSGSGGISFSSPGTGNTGSITINSDISNALPWLLFPWNQGNPKNALSPNAVVTFGIYQGNPKLIFFREMY